MWTIRPVHQFLLEVHSCSLLFLWRQSGLPSGTACASIEGLKSSAAPHFIWTLRNNDATCRSLRCNLSFFHRFVVTVAELYEGWLCSTNSALRSSNFYSIRGLLPELLYMVSVLHVAVAVMPTLPLLAGDLRFFASSPALPLWYINLPLFTSTVINIEYLVKNKTDLVWDLAHF